MSDASAGLHHHAPRPLGEYRAIERYIQETELEDVIFSAPRDSLPIASTSSQSRGQDSESQPRTLVSSQAEGEPLQTERPTKKPRSEKTPDGNKEDVSAMIGSLDEIAARLESIQERPELVCISKHTCETQKRPPDRQRNGAPGAVGPTGTLTLLGHMTMGHKFCVSSVSLRPRKGPGRLRPRLNSPTPNRPTATTHPHRADLGAASLQPAHKKENLLAS